MYVLLIHLAVEQKLLITQDCKSTIHQYIHYFKLRGVKKRFLGSLV